MDSNDSVGIIDSYFPEADFFTEFERFDRHLEKLKRGGTNIDYLVICSPNYLHDAHIRFGLRLGADVICEKPMVLNPWNVDALIDLEKDYPGKVYNILQLRLHPSVLDLKAKIDAAPKNQVFDIDLQYITARGKWYLYSWKGALEKSGGVATNIGIHFFDMLLWLFGPLKTLRVEQHTSKKAVGTLELERASVNWFLSIDMADIPTAIAAQGQRTFRSLTIGETAFEFSGGFTELHTRSYEQILEGGGYGMETVRPAIEVAYKIRKYFRG